MDLLDHDPGLLCSDGGEASHRVRERVGARIVGGPAKRRRQFDIDRHPLVPNHGGYGLVEREVAGGIGAGVAGKQVRELDAERETGNPHGFEMVNVPGHVAEHARIEQCAPPVGVGFEQFDASDQGRGAAHVQRGHRRDCRLIAVQLSGEPGVKALVLRRYGGVRRDHVRPRR